MHYVAVENGVKSSRIWQIISLWILTQNFQKFAQSSLNSPKTQIKQILKNIFENKEKKLKNLFGVFAQVKIGLKKILLQKETKIRKRMFWANTPN